jgi:hypothetical protein
MMLLGLRAVVFGVPPRKYVSRAETQQEREESQFKNKEG